MADGAAGAQDEEGDEEEAAEEDAGMDKLKPSGGAMDQDAGAGAEDAAAGDGGAGILQKLFG